MRGSRKFCQRGSNFDNLFFLFFFLVIEGRDYLNTTILITGVMMVQICFRKKVSVSLLQKRRQLSYKVGVMRGSRTFSQRGSNFDNVFFFFFFLVYEGRDYPNTTISGPSSARQGNAI